MMNLLVAGIAFWQFWTIHLQRLFLVTGYAQLMHCVLVPRRHLVEPFAVLGREHAHILGMAVMAILCVFSRLNKFQVVALLTGIICAQLFLMVRVIEYGC